LDKPEIFTDVLLHRKKDLTIQTKEELNPSVFVLFAVPKNIRVPFNINVKFKIEDIGETENPPVSFGQMELRYHSVVWVAYRSLFMNKWPDCSYLGYLDGIHFPFIFAKKNGQAEIRLGKLGFKNINGNLEICLIDLTNP
jgi:hypothetical protein